MVNSPWLSVFLENIRWIKLNLVYWCLKLGKELAALVSSGSLCQSTGPLYAKFFLHTSSHTLGIFRSPAVFDLVAIAWVVFLWFINLDIDSGASVKTLIDLAINMFMRDKWLIHVQLTMHVNNVCHGITVRNSPQSTILQFLERLAVSLADASIQNIAII